MDNFHQFPLDLRLFSEGEGSGVTASAAGMPSGVTAPDAGVQDPSETFEALITGQYKEQYDARVQDIIQKRLKDAHETQKRYEALTPVLTTLAHRYGIDDPQNVEALNSAILQDDAPRSPDITLEERIARRCQSWSEQEQTVRELYPSLRLAEEMNDPRFRAALRAGADVRTAYELTHRDEILGSAMRYAAEVTRQKLAEGIATQSARPVENGLNAQGAVLTRYDVSAMSRSERDAIRRRVAGGETIRF